MWILGEKYLNQLDHKGDNKVITALGSYKNDDFDKAADYFKEAGNKASLLQLYLTVARMELVISRMEQSEKYLEPARIICKELGDPEDLVKAIEEIEKIKESVDPNAGASPAGASSG